MGKEIFKAFGKLLCAQDCHFSLCYIIIKHVNCMPHWCSCLLNGRHKLTMSSLTTTTTTTKTMMIYGTIMAELTLVRSFVHMSLLRSRFDFIFSLHWCCVCYCKPKCKQRLNSHILNVCARVVAQRVQILWLFQRFEVHCSRFEKPPQNHRHRILHPSRSYAGAKSRLCTWCF